MAKKTIKSKAWNTCYFGMKKLVKLKKKKVTIIQQEYFAFQISKYS